MAFTSVVRAVFRLDTREAETGAKRFGRSLGSNVEGPLRRMASKAGIAGEALAGLGPAGLAAGAGIGVVGAAAFKFTKDTIALGTELADLKSKTGLSIQELQELKFASEQAGVGFQQTENAVLRLGRRAAAELPEATKWLDQLGLSVADIVERKPGDAFALVAEKIRGIPEPANQAAAAMGIFGDAGLQILPAINQGLVENIELFRALGGAMKDETSDAAKELSGQLTNMNVQWVAMKSSIGGEVIPILSTLTGFFAEQLPVAMSEAKALNLEWSASFVSAVASAIDVIPNFVLDIDSMAEGMRDYAGSLEAAAEEERESSNARIAAIESAKAVREATEQLTPAVQAHGEALGVAAEVARGFVGIEGEYPTVAEEMGAGLAEADADLATHRGFLEEAKKKVEEMGATTKGTTQVMSADWAEMERKRGALSGDFFGFMNESNADLLANSLNVFGSLSSEFKGVAIAGAIISTYSAIAKALGAYPWPFNLVAAAAAGAAGFANVNRIRSSEPGFEHGTERAGRPEYGAFGSGTRTVLHGREAVVPAGRTSQLAADIARAFPRQGEAQGRGGDVHIGAVNLNVRPGQPEQVAREIHDGLMIALRRMAGVQGEVRRLAQQAV